MESFNNNSSFDEEMAQMYLPNVVDNVTPEDEQAMALIPVPLNQPE